MDLKWIIYDGTPKTRPVEKHLVILDKAMNNNNSRHCFADKVQKGQGWLYISFKPKSKQNYYCQLKKLRARERKNNEGI
jgi:hypothetical protein